MRQITILDAQPADGGRVTVRSVFWLPVPGGFESPKQNQQSVIPRDDVLPQGGVTLDEIAAIQKGVVVEEQRTDQFPVSLGVEQVKSFLEAEYQDRATFFAAVPFKGSLFGATFVDGAWTK